MSKTHRWKVRLTLYGGEQDAFNAEGGALACVARTAPSRSTAECSTPDTMIEPPTDEEQALMAMLDIRFDAGAYCFEGCRYNRLVDAVDRARLVARQQRGTWN